MGRVGAVRAVDSFAPDKSFAFASHYCAFRHQRRGNQGALPPGPRSCGGPFPIRGAKAPTCGVAGQLRSSQHSESDRPMRARPGQKAGLTLKHFILQSEARALYRDVLRAIKGMDESTAAGVRQAARERFKENENESDIKQIQVLLVDGKHSLKEMVTLLGTVR